MSVATADQREWVMQRDAAAADLELPGVVGLAVGDVAERTGADPLDLLELGPERLAAMCECEDRGTTEPTSEETKTDANVGSGKDADMTADEAEDAPSWSTSLLDDTAEDVDPTAAMGVLSRPRESDPDGGDGYVPVGPLSAARDSDPDAGDGAAPPGTDPSDPDPDVDGLTPPGTAPRRRDPGGVTARMGVLDHLDDRAA